jgi:subtilase family serine protease
VDPSRVAQVQTAVSPKARPELDRGAADLALPMNFMVMMLKRSATQQADLDQLLADLQNPSSANYHKWLTPEEFGNRFELNNSDLSKVTAWLVSQGFKVERHARANNWIAFSGTAGKVSAALHTPIHRFEIDGKMRISNTGPPSVPEALAEVTAGFVGLTDIPLLE